uniref:Uncharacterized protein n=1 Tax=Romanomermis culicivorax TaxID=13658 RepID=A0A915IA80_ROMCU
MKTIESQPYRILSYYSILSVMHGMNDGTRSGDDGDEVSISDLNRFSEQKFYKANSSYLSENDFFALESLIVT